MQDVSQYLPNGQGKGMFLAVAMIFIAMEYVYGRLAHHDEKAQPYDLKETAASLGVAIGDITIRVLMSGLTAIPFFALYHVRLFDIPLDNAWAWAALFFGVEFCYYWFHRTSHRVRWLWATHAVHHSASTFNLSAAVRLGWTGQLTGAFAFFLPLALIGFHPLAIAVMIGLGLLYQFFLHTALPVHLGPLEWVLNTPRHHRVHHATNQACLDKNYGSVLIIFDRLFDTFATAPQDESLRFGLKGRATSNNPIRIALGEWQALARDVIKLKGWRQRLRVLLGPP